MFSILLRSKTRLCLKKTYIWEQIISISWWKNHWPITLLKRQELWGRSFGVQEYRRGTGLIPPNTEVFCFVLDFLQISWGKVSVHCQNFTEINIHATVKTSLLRQYGFCRFLFWGLKAADFAQYTNLSILESYMAVQCTLTMYIDYIAVKFTRNKKC